jgi:protein SCO1
VPGSLTRLHHPVQLGLDPLRHAPQWHGVCVRHAAPGQEGAVKGGQGVQSDLGFQAAPRHRLSVSRHALIVPRCELSGTPLPCPAVYTDLMKALTALLLALAAVMGGVLAYRTYAPRELHGTALDTPRPLSSVVLLDDRNQKVNLAASGGKMRLIFFGYTRCPDICPITLGVLAQAWDKLNIQQKARLQVQLVSVDPAFDTPTVLRRYLNGFSSDFQGLTGTDATIQAAAESLYVYAAQGKTPTSLVHGDGVALVDAQGRFLRVYNNQAVAKGELAADLPRLLN